ncbi:5144_t:CDS:1 [Dentiscutata erythropus]|uniref:5144_t:CDS:1 n=1 Tax=Dentiscutata erythropus TaxID=1348616 RepID=A0A9N9IEL3_9GLOM|nr:5144_t:CDS:1 [Dentiscutata erythropus]
MGFGDFLEKTLTTVATIGTAAAITVATGGTGLVVIGGLATASGFCFEQAGKEANDETLKKFGGFIKGVGLTTASGGGLPAVCNVVAEKVTVAEEAIKFGIQTYQSYEDSVEIVDTVRKWTNN